MKYFYVVITFNKKGVLVLLAYMLLMGNLTIAQNVFPLPPGFNGDVKSLYYDSLSNNLYAAGNFSSLSMGGTQMGHISKWNGTSWDSLGSGSLQNISDIDLYNGNLIVGGYFSEVDGMATKGLAIWNGISWQSFVDAVSFGNGCVMTLYVNSQFLYVGGCFDSIDGNPAQGIARYDGINWYTYPSFGGGFHYVNAIEIFNNELYIGGNFYGGPGKADIMKFDGNNWVSVGGGLTGANTWVNDFEIFQNNLFVSGYFQESNGDPGNNIAIWDGFNWSQLQNGLLPSNVFEIHVFNNKLYAGGQINDASGITVSKVAVWDGITWSGFDGITFDNAVGSFASSGNDLYLGGGFLTVNGDTMHRIAKYHLSVGQEEIEDLDLNIGPIPNHGNIAINLNWNEGVNLKLFDLRGSLIKKANDIKLENFSWDISELKDGTYFIQIISKEFVLNRKLIKISP